MNSKFHHILFWLFYAGIRIAVSGLYNMEFSVVSIQIISELPIAILLTYSFSNWIFPAFSARSIWSVLIRALMLMTMAILVRRLLMKYVLFPWLFAPQGYTFKFFDFYRFSVHFLEYLGLIGLFNAIRFYRDYRMEKKRVSALNEEKERAQLQMLKAQVNPHFLFNTLNSIYNEAVKGSDMTSELILQLSGLLRFVLKECSKDSISIEKEIELIKNYISMEKMRLGPSLFCDLKTEGPVSGRIPPMLIFSLVENAYKHGTSANLDRVKIEISIRTDLDRVFVQVKNSLPGLIADQGFKHSLGLGLKNTIAQLDLIYNDSYRYTANRGHGMYICELQMPFIDE